MHPAAPLPVRQNIVFSATRQWNPGDEIILFGTETILNAAGISYNPILYNRNPEVRPQFPAYRIFQHTTLADYNNDHEQAFLAANLRLRMVDNSLKADSPGQHLDWVVLAGSPEWCNGRMDDLFNIVLRHQLPVLIIGVGGGCWPYNEGAAEIIAKSKLFTTREGQTLAEAHARGFNHAQQLPCPALLSAPPSLERTITQPQRLGLIYQTTAAATVVWGGGNQAMADYWYAVMLSLIAQYRLTHEIGIICHYADEVALARAAFPDLPVYYSYNAADYFGIYAQFDAVVGPRVHGIGTAASVGVPGIALVHDQRGQTCAGFLADLIQVGDPLEQVLALTARLLAEGSTRNQQLRTHKAATLARYVELVHGAMTSHPQGGKIPYETPAPPLSDLPHYPLPQGLPDSTAAMAARPYGPLMRLVQQLLAMQPAQPNQN